MKNEYVKLWASYKKSFALLSYEEVGRLVMGMLDYKETGQEPDLPGSERFVWPSIQHDIDSANESFKRRSEANKGNGALGGRATQKKNRSEAKPSEFKRNQANSSETKRNENVHLNSLQGKERKGTEWNGDGIEAASAAESSEPGQARSEPIAQLLLKDDTLFDVTQEMVDELKPTYPNVNVERQIRRMADWCRNARPSNRKTRRGAPTFISNWLEKEQKDAEEVGAPLASQAPEKPQAKISEEAQRWLDGFDD